MSTRERERGIRTGTTVVGEGIGGSNSDTIEARERTARLAEAGDRAIREALSQDSARFLAQNRQEGGE